MQNIPGDGRNGGNLEVVSDSDSDSDSVSVHVDVRVHEHVYVRLLGAAGAGDSLV